MPADHPEVSDPTDWDVTRFAFLAPLDQALRCEICKDFYTAPVLTSCSHTFCSLCIRRTLVADGKCPTCRAPVQEYTLRKNNTVQDVLDAFADARPRLLDFGTREDPAEEDRGRVQPSPPPADTDDLETAEIPHEKGM